MSARVYKIIVSTCNNLPPLIVAWQHCAWFPSHGLTLTMLHCIVASCACNIGCRQLKLCSAGACLVFCTICPWKKSTNRKRIKTSARLLQFHRVKLSQAQQANRQGVDCTTSCPQQGSLHRLYTTAWLGYYPTSLVLHDWRCSHAGLPQAQCSVEAQ
jgi:hypothetical protein